MKWIHVTTQRLFWLAMQYVKRRESPSLHCLSSATQHQCYKTENTWLLEYDFDSWFCKWAEFWELRLWGQLHRRSIDDMQTSDMDIQILFDLLYNPSLQFFFFIWKVAPIPRARNRLIFPYWLYNIWMPKRWLCARRRSSWLTYLNSNLYIAVLKCKNLWITFSVHKLSIKW